LASIGELKKRMPKEFIAKLYQEEGSVLADKILSGMGNPRKTSLRANTLKTNALHLLHWFNQNAMKYQRVSWYLDAFMMATPKKVLEDLSLYHQGHFYMQSLSSMIPPFILNPQKGDKILDMAAAPGSKTTQMAAMMQNQGEILANEPDLIRLERLKYNLNHQGAHCVKTMHNFGEKLGKLYPQSFDKVLLDAPCSGEGRFMYKEPITTRYWNLKAVADFSRLQKKLFASGVEALKPKGILVYATCTLNYEENEGVVLWALKNTPVSLCPFQFSLPHQPLIPLKNLDTPWAFKIMPTKEMEGFFIACFKKNNG